MSAAGRSGRGRAGDSATSARRGRRRRGHGGEAAEGGSERWLVTYADVLTLLLVLFIVLFSISVVNTGKFMSLKTSLSSAFGGGRPSVLSGGSGLKENDSEAQGMQLVLPGSTVAGADGTAMRKESTPASSTTKPRYPAAVEKEGRDFTTIERAIRAAAIRRGIGGAVRFSI